MQRKFHILLARPRGFCAGVERAIDVVERALERFGAPIYVRHEIVHNKRVVETLKEKGAVFVNELDEVPDDVVTIFSAHGVSDAVVTEAKNRGLPVIDATCPLVTKVHKEGRKHSVNGNEIILIGHDGHPEVEGTRGRIPGKVHVLSSEDEIDNLSIDNPEQVAYVTQTTLSVDDTRGLIESLNERFPAIKAPKNDDICYATQNRQQAVRDLCDQVDLLLVVGAKNSSNSNRLKEIGDEMGIPSCLIDDADGLKEEWLDDVSTIGITAGASAPEELIEELLLRLKDLGDTTIEQLPGIKEDMHFRLPKELVQA